MHSSRMCTVRSSGRISGGGSVPGWVWVCVCSLGGVSAPGVSALGGVCSQGCVCSWGCLLPGGVCSQGGVCSGGSVCSGGCLLQGMSALGGGVVSQHGLRQTPPPCGQTDACKNFVADGTNQLKQEISRFFYV